MTLYNMFVKITFMSLFINYIFTSIFLFFLPISLFGANPLLKSQGIVDIGKVSEYSRIEVPKEYISVEPNILSAPNQIIYSPRIQSELFACEIDFLGTTICPVEKIECETNEEYQDGYSTKHTTTKSFVQICPPNTIKVGAKCYADENNDGIKDYTYYHLASSKRVWSTSLRWAQKVEHTISKNLKPYSYIKITHRSRKACDNDRNYFKVKVNGKITINRNCRSGVNISNVQVYKNSTSNYRSVDLYYSDQHGWLGGDSTTLTEYTYELISQPPIGFIIEEVGSTFYSYTNTRCPNDTTLQSDGSCKMTYDWYSYHCPLETNYYEKGWVVVDSGGDCGHSSCVNSSTPPANNCVRVNYSCPINSSSKCAKGEALDKSCEEGYSYQNSRCERDEPYCGNGTYNSSKDICEDITSYEKLCLNSSDTYSAAIDKCQSSTKICPQGTYDSTLGTCTQEYNISCDEGYTYDESKQSCIGEDLEICQNGYRYDESRNSCISDVTICAVDEEYDESTNSCTKSLCQLDGVSTGETRCESEVVCDGILREDGRCIPNEVVR
jgi:hypothetical protein